MMDIQEQNLVYDIIRKSYQPICDETYAEVFVERAMNFIDQLLRKFLPIEEQQQKELDYMKKFEQASEQEQKQMLPELTRAIHKYYRPIELNIDGYLKQSNDKNFSAMISVLIKDWKEARELRTQQLKQAIIQQSIGKWEQNLKEYGNQDYKARLAIKRSFFHYPPMKEIIELIGREQESNSKQIVDDYLNDYLPILPSRPTPAAETEEITLGQSVRHLLPIELAIMADQSTADLFYQKYATRQLQLFANKPKTDSIKKTIVKQKEQPRLDKGPIIVAIDTSGSMSGESLDIACSLLYQLIKLAKSQKRNCFLISFSVEAQAIDLATNSSWKRVEEFIKHSYTGGTDGEEMIYTAIKALSNKQYENADVLIISDFQFAPPLPTTRKQIEHNQSLGTKFYGLSINKNNKTYSKILDRLWIVYSSNNANTVGATTLTRKLI